MAKQKWFYFEELKVSLDIAMISEIHWETTDNHDQGCTALYSNGVSAEFIITNTCDRVALRKLIVGDDWQPPEVIAEKLIKSLNL